MTQFIKLGSIRYDLADVRKVEDRGSGKIAVHFYNDPYPVFVEGDDAVAVLAAVDPKGAVKTGLKEQVPAK